MAAPPLMGARGSTAALTVPPLSRHEARATSPTIAYLSIWIVLGLTLLALLSRVFTTNSLAGEPTSDEYLYAIHARDLALAWAAGQGASLRDLSIEGRSVAVEAAALSFILPWDPLTIGRSMQALLNALCVPMTFVLARQVGLPRLAGVSAALLLLAAPEFQELAWRFWTDSQATLLGLIYISAVVAFVRRPAVISGLLAVVSLGLLVLTKESAAVTFTPFLGLAAAVPLSRRFATSTRGRVAVAAAVLAVGVLGLGVLMVAAPSGLADSSLLQKTFGAGPLILSSVREAVPRLPAYSEQLTGLIGSRELGAGLMWGVLLGYTWLLAQSGVALATAPVRTSAWVVGWLLAAAIWALALVTPARDLGASGLIDPWIALAAGGLLVAIGTVEQLLRGRRYAGWGMALLGLVVLAVLAERLIISVTPKVGTGAALTFRSLMPVVPLFAILAGAGVWAAAGAVSLLAPSIRSGRLIATIGLTLFLITFWSPVLRTRFSSEPLIGRVADRGADPGTPQGLRVEALVEAEGWLRANLRPTDVIITGLPRHLAWYADLGVDGMNSLIDLGSQPRNDEQRRQFILERFGPQGAAYLVDFNVAWADPQSDAARAWRQTFETLASRPNLEVAYLKRDRFGNPVFFVIRNHGFANAPR